MDINGGSRRRAGPYRLRGMMLSWALIFLVVAIIAAILSFGGIAGAAASIAKILFVIFLVLFVLGLIMHLIGGRRPPL